MPPSTPAITPPPPESAVSKEDIVQIGETIALLRKQGRRRAGAS